MAKQSRVAIIGRANVGKSTLFNRLTSGPKALVSDIAGTTRDKKEGECEWLDQSFTIIDTGGLDIDPEERIEQKIAEQAISALSDADVILFVVDVRKGITPADIDIANLLRETKKKVYLVANKADKARLVDQATEFFSLGFGKPWAVSAANGNGTGDLLDDIVKNLKTTKPADREGVITVAIIGKPNVGKSSLINALTGEQSAIVHDMPYTTRDTNGIDIVFHGTTLHILDTAGVRRKAKIDKGSIEADSARMSLDAIRIADVVLFVTEANKELTAQDRQLAGLIDQSKASVIVIGNKWDLVEDKSTTIVKEFEEYYGKEFNFINWAPMLMLSAKNRTKLTRLKETIMQVHNEQFRTITDNALSKFLKTAVKRQKPTIGKGTKKPYIFRIKQVGTKPPQFIVFIHAKSSIRYTYLNFLERMLREKFGFEGAPIKIWVEKTNERLPS